MARTFGRGLYGLWRFYSTRGKRTKVYIGVALSLFVLFLVFGTISGFIRDWVIVSTVTGTISDKYSRRVANDTHETYHIYVKYADGSDETFHNRDSFWRWKWSSADYFNRLERGKTYKMTVTGIRFPFFSWFRNIVSFEEVTPQGAESKSERHGPTQRQG